MVHWTTRKHFIKQITNQLSQYALIILLLQLNDIEKEEIELKEYRFRQFTFINNFISMMFRHLKSKPVDSYIPWWFDNHVRKW